MSPRPWIITRRIPGFVWVQAGLSRKWRIGSWWAVKGIAKTRALGPFRLCTMRDDALARSRKAGIFK